MADWNELEKKVSEVELSDDALENAAGGTYVKMVACENCGTSFDRNVTSKCPNCGTPHFRL